MTADAHALLAKKLGNYKRKLEAFMMTPEQEKAIIEDFKSPLEDKIAERLAVNQKEIESANQKIVLVPLIVAGGGMAWTMVPHVAIGVVAAGGCCMHLKGNSAQVHKPIYDVDTLKAFGADIAEFSKNRYKDMQAIVIVGAHMQMQDVANSAMCAATNVALNIEDAGKGSSNNNDSKKNQ